MNLRWLKKLNKVIWEQLEKMEDVSDLFFFVDHLFSQDVCVYVYFFTHIIPFELLYG